MLIVYKLVPLFLVGFIGFFCCKIRFISKDSLPILNRVMFYIALPVMLFNSIVSHPLNKSPLDIVATVSAAILLCFLMLIILSTLLFGTSKSPEKATWVNCALQSNQAIFLPIVFSFFGNEGLALAGITASTAVIFHTTASVCGYNALSGRTSVTIWSTIKNLLKTPSILGVVLGLIVAQTHIAIPKMIFDTLKILEGMFLPLVLLTIGAQLASRPARFAGFSTLQVGALQFFKLFILPVAGLILGILFKLDHMELQVVAFSLCSPTANVCSVFAAELGGSPRHSAQMTLIGHALCPLIYIVWSLALSLLA